MSAASFIKSDVLSYIQDHTRQEDALLNRLRDETTKLPMAVMQISADQGAFFEVLVKMIHAKNAIEIGVFTGYSSICIARNLQAGGKLIACDIDEDYTNIAKKYWQEAGIQNKIDLHLAPAEETLEKLIEDKKSGTFDFVFIDANKQMYDTYYEQALKLLRSGGVIAVDNALWGGEVATVSGKDKLRDAIMALNAKIKKDDRVMASLIAVGDGIHLAVKK